MNDYKYTDIGEIPIDWTLSRLGNLDTSKDAIKTGPFGSLLHSYDYADEGRPLLLVKNINDGRLVDDDYPLVNFQKADELTQFWLKKGDIVYTRVGEVGRTLHILKKFEGWMFSGQTLRIRINNENVNNKFIEYFLRSPIHRHIASKTALGSTRESINTTILSNAFIPLPKKSEQDRIVETLSSFEQKIDLLRRQNDILEQIAQTLFKRWFVDFEFPDENGRPYKSSGGDMVTSELGEIPVGWHVGNINECVSIIIDYRGKTPKKLGMDWSTSGTPVLSAKNIKNGNLVREDSTYFGSEELYRKWMKDELRCGDVLLTSEAPLGEVFYLADDKKYILSQRLFALRVNQKITSSYLYTWLKSYQGQLLLDRRATGSTVEGIRQEELRQVEIVIPDNKVIRISNSIWEKIFSKINTNRDQLNSLTKLRDLMLPKLMSGKIRVRN